MRGRAVQTRPPPKNVENIEFVKTASRPVWHPGGCIGASNGASTALKLPGKPEIHVFFVRLYTYSTVRIILGPVNRAKRDVPSARSGSGTPTIQINNIKIVDDL